jgi:O-antigen ligase
VPDFVAQVQRSDAATLVAVFIVVLMIVPARMVVSGVPFSLTPADLVALLAALMWFCAHFTNTLGMAKGTNPVRTALFVYSTALLACYGYAMYGYLPDDEANLADHYLVLVVALVGIALAVVDGVRGDQRLDLVLKTMVVAGAVVAFIGACQFLLNLDLTEYLALPGLHFYSEVPFVTERSDMRRVAATTGHPIEFGVLCAMLLPIAAHFGFRTRAMGTPSLRWWLCTAMISSGLMFSVSRSAVLGVFAVGTVLFIGWPARRRLGALIVSAGFLVPIKLVAPGLLGTFYGLFANASSDDSLRYRTHDYAAAGAEISQHVWLGRGMGTWYAPKHQVFDNQYILSTVETGVVGVVVFAGVFLTAIYAAVRARMISADPVRRDLGLTLAACLMVPLIGSATFDLFSFPTVTGLAFVLVGAVGALLRTVRTPASGDGLRSAVTSSPDGRSRGTAAIPGPSQ